MNTWQALQQMRYLLRQAEWAPGVVVWNANSIIVTVAPDPDAASTERTLPMVLLRPGSSRVDPRHDGEFEDLIEVEIAVRLVTSVPGDRFGEASLMGGHRAGELETPGKGLLELEEKLLGALREINDGDGMRIQLRATSAAGAQPMSDSGYMIWRDYTFVSLVTAERDYSVPTALTATVAALTVSLSWTLPSTRFDTDSVVLRRASGSTPPSGPTDGTGVALTGDLVTSVSEAPGVGSWSYALFSAYDEHGAGSPQQCSAAATATVTVVGGDAETLFAGDAFSGDLFAGDLFAGAA